MGDGLLMLSPRTPEPGRRREAFWHGVFHTPETSPRSWHPGDAAPRQPDAVTPEHLLNQGLVLQQVGPPPRSWQIIADDSQLEAAYGSEAATFQPPLRGWDACQQGPGRAHPHLPDALPEPSNDHWGALDHIPVVACLVSPFAHLENVPHEQREGRPMP